MKTIIVVATVTAVALAVTGAACAAGGEELAKSAGCLNCHAVDTKKIGPSYKDVAAKFKGKSEADVFATWKAAKPHASVKASEDDVKTVLAWIVTL